MRKLLSLIVLISFLGCGGDNSGEKKQAVPLSKMATYINSLKDKFPNYKTNSIVLSDLNDSLRSDFVKKIDEGFFDDMKFKLSVVFSCYDDNYILWFSHNHSQSDDEYDEVELDFYALTKNDTLAKSVVEGKSYYLKGNFIDLLNGNNNFQYCSKGLYQGFYGISSEDSTKIGLGTVVIRLKNLSDAD